MNVVVTLVASLLVLSIFNAVEAVEVFNDVLHIYKEELTSLVPTLGACSRAFRLIRHLVCTKSKYSFEFRFFSS